MQLFLLAMLILLVYPMLVVVQKLVPKKDVTQNIDKQLPHHTYSHVECRSLHLQVSQDITRFAY